MNLPATKIRVSFADYVAFETASETKHQFFDGEVFDMSGGTPEHAAIASKVATELGIQLRGKACRGYSSDLRIRAGELATYPDMSVVCGPLSRDPGDSNTVLNPTVIVEVLSDSTEAFDRGKKFENYRQIDSLQDYVLVNQHEAHLEVYHRSVAGWILTEARKGEKIRIESIDCELDVDSVYEGVWEDQVSSPAT